MLKNGVCSRNTDTISRSFQQNAFKNLSLDDFVGESTHDTVRILVRNQLGIERSFRLEFCLGNMLTHGNSLGDSLKTGNVTIGSRTVIAVIAWRTNGRQNESFIDGFYLFVERDGIGTNARFGGGKQRQSGKQ